MTLFSTPDHPLVHLDPWRAQGGRPEEEEAAPCKCMHIVWEEELPLACVNAYQLRTLMVGDSCASRGCCALGGCQGVPPARAGAPEPMAGR